MFKWSIPRFRSPRQHPSRVRRPAALKARGPARAAASAIVVKEEGREDVGDLAILLRGPALVLTLRGQALELGSACPARSRPVARVDRRIDWQPAGAARRVRSFADPNVLPGTRSAAEVMPASQT